MNQVSRVEYLGRLELINLAKRIHYNLFIISEHIYSKSMVIIEWSIESPIAMMSDRQRIPSR